jgi:alanine-glyoxylate transaminase/serine-glyoxylate transaminase/serine-pyruvate transaminase
MLRTMDAIAERLRNVFACSYPWTLALSGTGTSGMEATLANLLQGGERVMVLAHGYFGLRLAEIARRAGAEVELVEGEWGRASDPLLARQRARGRRFHLLCAVHAETSTGVLQDLRPLRELADGLGALLLVDAVTSLACVPLEVEDWGVDAVYSCSQKGLSCVSGLAPLALSPRAQAVVQGRSRSTASFYLDLGLLMEYWAGSRTYHHTASSQLYGALAEALRLVLEEGLPARFERHRRHSAALVCGLEALGLELLAPAAERLPQLCAVKVPTGVDDARLRRALLENHGIEIGGGLGPLKGRLWRLGLMGHGARRRNVLLLLAALREALTEQGFRVRDDGVEAARARYGTAS